MNKCCMNCSYLWADPDISICGIDKETIPECLWEIKFCNAYEEWWGAVE